MGLGAASWLGCPKSSAGPDAGAGLAPDASTGPLNAEVEFTLRYELPDAGVAVIPTGLTERPLIEATRSLELISNQPISNYRIRLFDEADRAMVSDDEAQPTDAGVTYRMGLPAPLKTGHKYTLVLEPQTGATILDARGKTVPEQRIEFAIAGTKEKPAPPPKPPRRRRR